MIRTIEAIIDERGAVRPLEVIQLPAARRALVIILEEEPALHGIAPASPRGAVLAADGERAKEEAAWSHLGKAGPSLEEIAGTLPALDVPPEEMPAVAKEERALKWRSGHG